MDMFGSLGLFGIMLIVIGIINFVSYYFSDRIVLGMSGAKPLTKTSHLEVFRIVE
ncbi:MAG: hypothetical protein ACD_20C00220G0001, partial [uncultured bacterium]